MLSFNSYGEWTKTSEDDDGDAYYIDFQTVKKLDNGNVVFWVMVDSAKGVEGVLDNELYMSSKMFWQGDCDLFRFKVLSITQFEKPMGGGDNESYDGYLELMGMDAWNYLPPDSIGYMNLNEICSLAEHYSKNNYEEKVLETIAEFESYDWGDDDASYASSSDWIPPNASASGDSWECNVGYVRNNNGCKKLDVLLETAQSVYINKIASKVVNNWRYQSAKDDWTAEVYVVQDRNGNVRAVDVRNANVGDSPRAKSFMDSIERAVYKSSPLPYTSDDDIFDREIYILFSVK